MKLLTLKREALAAGMREHTKAPIHASLTEMDSKRSKIACRMFKNIKVLQRIQAEIAPPPNLVSIQGFMGDRHYESPLLLAEEALRTALQVNHATQSPTHPMSRPNRLPSRLCLASFAVGAVAAR